MKIGIAHIIKRNGKNGILSPFQEPLQTDEVIETRKILLAEEGKSLYRNGEEVGQCLWLKAGDSEGNYTEQDIPPEEAEEDGTDGTERDS